MHTDRMVQARLLSLLILFISLASLSGCMTTQRTIKPEDIVESGLLFASFQHNGVFYRLDDGNAIIDGLTRVNAVQDGHIVLALEPGNHTLERIQLGPISYNFNVSFDVEVGRVTNLGLCLLFVADQNVADRIDPRTRFKAQVFFIQNDRDARGFLQKQHAEIYSRLKSKEFLHPIVTYLSKRQIDKFRYDLFTRRYKLAKYGMKWLDRNQAGYATAELGTLAKFKRTRSGSITDIQLIETGSYEPMTHVATHSKRFACIQWDLQEGYRLWITENNKLTKKPLSNIDDQGQLILVGERGVVISDRSLRLQISTDNGTTWETYNGAALAQPLPRHTGPGAKSGKKGYYLYSFAGDSTLLYRDYHHTRPFVKIAAPVKGFKYYGIIETSRGLLTRPNDSDWSKSHYYFLPAGTDQWIKQECPTNMCNEIAEENATLKLKCKGKYWHSSDLGKTWRQIPTP